MVAKPGGRQTIVEEQRRPSDFKVPRYQGAADALRRYLFSGGADASILERAIESQKSAVPTTQWSQVNQANCVGALERLPKLLHKLQLGDTRTTLKNDGILLMSSVEVSVRPEVIVVQREGGIAGFGAIKLYLGKSKPLTKTVGSYIAVVLQQYMEVTYPNSTIQRSLCQVLDVFSGQLWTAPEAQKRRRIDLVAACREIYARWTNTQVAA